MNKEGGNIKLILKNALRLGNSNTTLKVLALAGLAALTVPTSLLGYAVNDAEEIGSNSNTTELVAMDTEVHDVGKTSAKSSDKVESEIASVLGLESGSAIQVNTLGTSSMLKCSIEAGISNAIADNEIIKSNLTKTEQNYKVKAEKEKEEQSKDDTSSRYLVGKTVYKPSSHYIHLASCKWADDECVEVPSYDSIKSVVKAADSLKNEESSDEKVKYHICTDCRPIGGMDEHVGYWQTGLSEDDVQLLVESQAASEYGLSDYEILLLRKIVSSEYGSDWVPVEEKAKVVASVMNQVWDPRYPDTIEGALYQSCVPFGFYITQDYYMSDSIYAAVEYYFENKDTVFADWVNNSWWGDGTYNHFYYN
jgi:hypothetical protein